jgi:hypothetical protein
MVPELYLLFEFLCAAFSGKYEEKSAAPVSQKPSPPSDSQDQEGTAKQP